MKLKHKEATITGGSYKFTLPAFPRPVFADTLKFPQDITELETENVSDLLGKYTQMLCYVQHQLATATVKIIELEAKLEQVSVNSFLEDPRSIHLERWRRDLSVQADSRVILIKGEITRAKMSRDLAQSYVINYERCISALSRELTRKMSLSENRKPFNS